MPKFTATFAPAPMKDEDRRLIEVSDAIAVAEKRLSDLNEEADRIETTNEQARSASDSLDAINADLAGAQLALELAKTELARTNAEHKRVQEQIGQIAIELERTNNEIAALLSKKGVIEKEIATLEDRLTISASEYEKQKTALDADISSMSTTADKLRQTVANLSSLVESGKAERARLVEECAKVAEDIKSSKQKSVDYERAADIAASTAKIVIEQAEKKAVDIVESAKATRDEVMKECDGIRDNAQKAVFHAQEVDHDTEVKLALLQRREANIEEIKQNVLIEIGRELRTLRLENGNKVIQEQIGKLNEV